MQTILKTIDFNPNRIKMEVATPLINISRGSIIHVVDGKGNEVAQFDLAKPGQDYEINANPSY